MRRSASRLVRSRGYRAETFDSAEAFLDSPQATSTACLILDVRMPGVDGLELQRRLNESGRRIPIIFVTALATDEEGQRALRAGAVAVLRKPVDEATLFRLLDSILEGPVSSGGADDTD